MPAVRPVGPALLDHLDTLYGYALLLTRSQAEGEDLAQETCLRALRSKGTLRGDSDLKCWLFTVLRLNQIRRRPTPPATPAIDAEESGEAARQQHLKADPETIVMRMSERKRMQAALTSLQALYREIRMLREGEGVGSIT